MANSSELPPPDLPPDTTSNPPDLNQPPFGNTTPPQFVGPPNVNPPISSGNANPNWVGGNYVPPGSVAYGGTSPDPYGGSPGRRGGGYANFLRNLGSAIDPNRDVSFSPRDLGYGGPMSGLDFIGNYFDPGGSNYWNNAAPPSGTAGGPSWWQVRSH